LSKVIRSKNVRQVEFKKAKYESEDVNRTYLKTNRDSVLQNPVRAERDVARAPVVALVDARRIGVLEVFFLEQAVLVVPRFAAALGTVADKLRAVVHTLTVLKIIF
jgi:hypothetical protein